MVINTGFNTHYPLLNTKKMNWGHGIAIFFTCFVAFITFLVVKSHQQNIDLVTENYYQQELQYQHQIEKIQNNQQLEEKVKITADKGEVYLHFPKLSGPVEGQVQVFRPSDARFDLTEELKPDSQNQQQIATSTLPPGFYRIKINWQAGGQDYYTEETLHLR